MRTKSDSRKDLLAAKKKWVKKLNNTTNELSRTSYQKLVTRIDGKLDAITKQLKLL